MPRSDKITAVKIANGFCIFFKCKRNKVFIFKSSGSCDKELKAEQIAI